MKYFLVCCALLVAGCGNDQREHASGPPAAVPEPARFDTTIDSLRSEVQALAEIVRKSNAIEIPDTLMFCGERVPVERWWVRKELEEAFRFYTGFARNRKRIDVYLREARIYFPFITARLKEASLPEDLKYIPVAESEFNLQAQSSQKAVGMWQLMSSTGREKSLRMNKFIDERKDFERATDAAIGKLTNDYTELGNWFLTLAAYNAGINRVKRSLATHADSSYFNLILPPETMEYCYRLVALKFILEHPYRYGFSEQPEAAQRIRVITHSVREKTTVPELARLFEVPGREFQLLNPQFTTTTVPRGTYRLRIPESLFSVSTTADSSHVVH